MWGVKNVFSLILMILIPERDIERKAIITYKANLYIRIQTLYIRQTNVFFLCFWFMYLFLSIGTIKINVPNNLLAILHRNIFRSLTFSLLSCYWTVLSNLKIVLDNSTPPTSHRENSGMRQLRTETTYHQKNNIFIME